MSTYVCEGSARISQEFVCDPTLSSLAVRVGCYLCTIRSPWSWSCESVAAALDMDASDVRAAILEMVHAGWASQHEDGTILLYGEIRTGTPPTHEWDQWQTDIAREQWQRERFHELVAEVIETVRPLTGGWGEERIPAVTAYIEQEMKRAFPEPPPWRPERRKAKIASSLRTAVYERDGYACVVCGIRKDLTIDHIIPESKGGPTVLENCQTMCRSHNSQKGDR